MCGYTQFLSRTSIWEILNFNFHVRKCSLLQDFNIWFHGLQTFFSQCHRATSSFNIWQYTYEDRQLSNSACFYPFSAFYSAPLQSLSLQGLQCFVCLFPPSFVSWSDLLSSEPLRQHHCSWWQPIAFVQLSPGVLSFIDPFSHLRLLLHLLVTSIF